MVRGILKIEFNNYNLFILLLNKPDYYDNNNN